jgi:hypothetical protein
MKKKYLILVACKMRSGKNTFADIFKGECLEKDYEVKLDSFASVLKEWCSEEFKGLTDYLNKFGEEFKASIPDLSNDRFNGLREVLDKKIKSIQTKKDNWFEEKNDITRLILQIVGTNLIRKHVDDDFWIKEFVKKVKNYKEDFVVVTDARFPNEIDLPFKLVEDRRVISIRVERNTGIQSNHPSETALDNYNWFDYHIDNNGDLKQLQDSVKTIIQDIENTEVL